MQFFLTLAIAAAATASPLTSRWITTKLTLCTDANLQNCDDTFVPIDTCCKSPSPRCHADKVVKVPECTVQSLNAQGHICDFYS